MVMAAGLGTRMRPLTETRPKPLIPVAGRALIDHMLDALAAVGVEKAVVNVHYLAPMMLAHLGPRTTPRIAISDERPRLMETGGGLVQAAPLLGDRPIFVTNTDQVWRTDGADPLADMLAAWDGLRMDVLLLLARKARTTGFDGAGDFFLAADGRVGRRGAAAEAPFVYAGVQILHPRLLEGWPLEPFSTNRIWDLALERARVFAVPLEGDWMHVGDPNGLKAAEARLA
ncbi:MAG: nucleotidyltransferase family protein [Alphaproteobacteria bacterium]|nr:nucleotidyltransferase family protein [Alphaproteobacteria bacterium]